MKKNDILDLRTKTTDELKRTLIDLREEIEKLHVEKTLGKLKNTNMMKLKRKDIARVKTILHMKNIMNVGKEESQKTA